MAETTPSSPPQIDIVIPVWNDEEALGNTLPLLLQEWRSATVYVVDGGSHDQSVSVAHRHGVHVVQTGVPSRARQMNAGVAAGEGEVILFLHADTQLPSGAWGLIAGAVSSGVIGGAFRRRFDHPSFFLRATCLAADWRGQWFGAFLGDQAIFATRKGFREVGGFPDQPLFEDFEFTRRLSERGRTVLLRRTVISSGRRFKNKGPIWQTLEDFALTLRYIREGEAFFSGNKSSRNRS